MTKGKFITIDGVEGAGKSTQIAFIKKYLQKNGIDVILTREPGGTLLGEGIRNLLLDNKFHSMNSDTELLLMFAARNEHIYNKILPFLEKGIWVLSDRFTDASFAYQGGGRKLALDRIEIIEKWVQKKFQADLTIILDLNVNKGLKRITKRSEKDRIEKEDIDFFNRVRKVFLDRVKKYPNRIKLVDSSKSIPVIKNDIKKILDNFIKQ